MSQGTIASHKKVLQIAQNAAMDLGYDPRDAALGKWNFRGWREVFVGSRYIGCINNDGEFVNDRRS